MNDQNLIHAIENFKSSIGFMIKNVGCYAVSFDSFDGTKIQFQIREEKLDLIDAELEIIERDDKSFPYELSKTINGVKFFSITK